MTHSFPTHRSSKLFSGKGLVRYLDRFLMYYIRTADRLQRTSTWLGTIDGGLDRVREIVIDDALGLGAELEAEMARHVETYFDEWKATIEDEEKLYRFVSFVKIGRASCRARMGT